MGPGNRARALGCVLLFASCTVSCTGDIDESDALEGEVADDGADDVEAGEECTLYAAVGCSDGNVHAVDSCGSVHELLDECSGDQFCQAGIPSCCTPALSSGPSELDLDPYVTRGHVTLSGVATELSWEVEILESTSTEPFKQYVITVHAGSDRLAIQFMANNGALGVPALGLTSWDRGDNSVRTEPGGIVEPSQPSTYIGVRRAYPWGVGVYTVRLAKTDMIGTGEHFYELSIQGETDAEPTVIGAVGASPISGQSEPLLSAKHTHYLYNYSGAIDLADVEQFVVRSVPSAPDAEVTLVTSAYSAFPNTEIRWETDAIYMGMGLGVARCTSEGELFAR